MKLYHKARMPPVYFVVSLSSLYSTPQPQYRRIMPPRQRATSAHHQRAIAPWCQRVSVPVRQRASVPVRQRASAPSCHRSVVPLRRHATAPSRHFAVMPPLRHATSPSCHRAAASSYSRDDASPFRLASTHISKKTPSRCTTALRRQASKPRGYEPLLYRVDAPPLPCNLVLHFSQSFGSPYRFFLLPLFLHSPPHHQDSAPALQQHASVRTARHLAITLSRHRANTQPRQCASASTRRCADVRKRHLACARPWRA